MAERIKIAIPFYYNENWIGGVYYIINLIKALKLLANKEKPHVIIFYNNEKSINLLKEINYPYIKFEKEKSWRDYNLLQRAVNKLSRKLIKKNIFEYRPNKKNIDILFPANDSRYFNLISDKNKLFWIPDFQEHFLPDFFTKEEIIARQQHQKNLIKRNVNIVFSSYSALNDFNNIYPENKNKKNVIQFAVSPQKEYEKIDFEKLLQKYNIPSDYFICSNQFWAHKNHITLLKAIKKLKQNNVKCHFVFTGNTSDYRNLNFYKSLLDFVKDEELNDYVSFLGFIDRKEQLKLMSEAIAVIQPSLFEGWGTVAEDAKSMNKHIILSDIDIHKEQCKENVTFFEKKNEKELSKVILDFIEKSPVIKNYEYKNNQIKFVETFLETIIKSQNLA